MESRAPDRHPVRLAVWLAIVGLLTVLNFADRLLGPDRADDLAYRYSTAVAAALSYGLILAIVLLLTIGLSRGDLLGLRSPVSWRRALRFVGVSLAAVYAIVFAYGFALSLLTDANPSCEQGLAPTEWDPSRAGAFAAFAVSVVVVGPVVEELLYRGLGYGLLAPYGAGLAILTTGVLFAASHGLVYGFLPLAAFGLILGWVRMRAESAYPPMALHSAFNGLTLAVALAASSPC